MTTNAAAKPARKVSPDKKSGKAVEGEIRPVAKSLHTLTVIVQVARIAPGFTVSPERAIESAMEILGLAGRPDPYGLEAKALNLLKAGA